MSHHDVEATQSKIRDAQHQHAIAKPLLTGPLREFNECRVIEQWHRQNVTDTPIWHGIVGARTKKKSEIKTCIIEARAYFPHYKD